MDVVCKSCKMRCHETTARFSETGRANGAMFRLKQKYKDLRWSSFPEVETTQPGHLECPNCGVLYTNGAGVFAANLERPEPEQVKSSPFKNKPGQRTSPVEKRRKSTPIPGDKNPVIIQMTQAGARPSAIGQVIGASKQAVTRRIMDLRKQGEL